MGARVRVAAATCLAAWGLLAGGAAVSGAPAVAEPAPNEAADAGAQVGGPSPDTPDPPAADPADPPAAGVDADQPEPADPVPADTDDDALVADAQAEEPAEKNADPREPDQECEKGDEHCGCGPWPWPWPWPHPVGVPQSDGEGGGGVAGGGGGAPSGRLELPPRLKLPAELNPPEREPLEPTDPDVVSVSPGVDVQPAGEPVMRVTMPVLVAPPAAVGPGGGASAPAPQAPPAPRGATAEPPAGREPLPATVGGNVTGPASTYRTGYTDYLRTAGMSEIALLAVPGVAGILLLTGAGGLVGYRQAKAGRAVHHSGASRFVN